MRAEPVTSNNVQLVPSRLLGPRPAPRARPPPAAFAQRGRRQPQAHCARWDISAWAAPMTSRIAQPPPAAIAQRGRRQPQAHCVRWGITARAAPVTVFNVLTARQAN